MSEMHLIEITKAVHKPSTKITSEEIHINRQRRDEMTEKKSKSFMVLLTEQ